MNLLIYNYESCHLSNCRNIREMNINCNMQKGRAIPNLVKYLRVVYDSELLLHECTLQLSTRLLSGWSNQLNLIMTVCLSLLSPLSSPAIRADLGAGSGSDQDNPLPALLSPGVCSCCRGQANTKSNILTKIYFEFRLGATLLSRHGHHLIDPGHCLSQPNGEE